VTDAATIPTSDTRCHGSAVRWALTSVDLRSKRITRGAAENLETERKRQRQKDADARARSFIFLELPYSVVDDTGP